MSIIVIHGPNTMFDNEEHAAVAGTPGYFVGGMIQEDPADFAELVTEVKPASPHRWVNGQYVYLGDDTHAYWNGSEWAVGNAPYNYIDTVEYSGHGQMIFKTNEGSSYDFYADVLPANLAALRSLNPTIDAGTDRWSAGDYIVLGNASNAYWDGSQWQAGTAPSEFVDGIAYSHPVSVFTWDGGSNFYPDVIPADLAALIALDPTIDTGNGRWVNNDHIVLGDESTAYWDGSDWQEGTAPNDYVDGVAYDELATFTSDGGTDFYPDVIPLDLAALIAIDPTIDEGTDRWTNGVHIVLGNASSAYWNGTAWVAGTALSDAVDGVAYDQPTSTFTWDGGNDFYPDVIPANLAALIALDPTIAGGPGAGGLGPWTDSDSSTILLGDDTAAYWDGDEWLLD